MWFARRKSESPKRPALAAFLPDEGAVWEKAASLTPSRTIHALCWEDGTVWDRRAGFRDDGDDVLRFINGCPALSPYIARKAA